MWWHPIGGLRVEEVDWPEIARVCSLDRIAAQVGSVCFLRKGLQHRLVESIHVFILRSENRTCAEVVEVLRL